MIKLVADKIETSQKHLDNSQWHADGYQAHYLLSHLGKQQAGF